MNMINVLQRLAELDSQNQNVVTAKPTISPNAAVEAIQKTLSEELSVDSLRYLSGVKETLEECGMMPGMSSAPTPASFSVNATASSGDEVANMINQIMNLAGARPVSGSDMPVDAQPKVFSGNGVQQGGELSGNDGMKRMMDMMNEPEDEGVEDALMPDMGAEEPMGGELSPVSGAEEPMGDTGTGPIGDVDIAGVGGALAGAAVHGDADGAAAGMDDGKDATYSGGEDMRKLIDAVMQPRVSDVDNTPAEPSSAQPFDSTAREYNPNAGGGGDRMDGNMPKGKVTFEDQLFAEYAKFVSEGKGDGNLANNAKPYDKVTRGDVIAGRLGKDEKGGKKVKEAMKEKCCCATKGEDSCPVHGVTEGEQKTMSRAAKGHEKYGKEGMQALAKAGKEGKDLDKVRAKYNKYD